MRVGIAAAGSGGHVFPALAVADELRRRGAGESDVVFFGGDRMEATTVPAAGYPFVGVDIHGIRRSLSLDNVKLPAKVRKARTMIVDEIRSNDLRAMVVFGGYIAGPAALAASKTGIPLIVHEANAVPGMANRMIARRADTVYVAFAPALQRLPMATVTGNPLRRDFVTYDREERRPRAQARYGITPGTPVLGVVGGSLGAQFLNEVTEFLASTDGRGFEIVHVTGPTHFTEISTRAEDVPGWHPLAFEDDMPDLYAASDLVLSRAGALTISELQATATPAVVVPLPAGGGYQALNATDLAEVGAVVVEPQTTIEVVAERVRDILGEPATLERMRSADARVDHRIAVTTIVDRIEEVVDA